MNKYFILTVIVLGLFSCGKNKNYSQEDIVEPFGDVNCIQVGLQIVADVGIDRSAAEPLGYTACEGKASLIEVIVLAYDPDISGGGTAASFIQVSGKGALELDLGASTSTMDLPDSFESMNFAVLNATGRMGVSRSLLNKVNFQLGTNYSYSDLSYSLDYGQSFTNQETYQFFNDGFSVPNDSSIWFFIGLPK